MTATRRRRSGPAIDPPTALEALASMAGNTTFRIPVGGRGTTPGRTSLDVAADLSFGSGRMECGHAWANIASRLAGQAPASTEMISDLVDAVIEQVDGMLRPQVSHRLRAGKLRLLLHMLIGNAVGSKATRRARAGERYTKALDPDEHGIVRTVVRERAGGELVPHPDFRGNPHWLPTYQLRAQALGMRLTDYAALEREVQAIVESKLSEAAAPCGRGRE